MQGLTLALALTGASALVAPAAPRAATALKAADEVFDYSSIAGGESGLGGRYDFDPMNFAGRYPGMVPWFREAELKHGRMCMLASIGMVVPAIVRVPGEQFQGTYTGWEAHDRLVASGSLGQILLFVGLAETLGGIPTIRAYGSERRFVTTNLRLLDALNEAYYVNKIADRWLSVRLELLGAAISLIAAVLGTRRPLMTTHDHSLPRQSR